MINPPSEKKKICIILKNLQYNFSTVTEEETTRITTRLTTPSTTELTVYRSTTYRNIIPYTGVPKTTNSNNNINSNNNKRITSETAENVALVIGIIAGALIAIVLIILVILKFKGRPEVNYKIDEGKGFCQDPNAALLGGQQMSGQPYNGSLKNGQGGNKNGKNRQMKDIKEWYV